jgi:hypothetical protein
VTQTSQEKREGKKREDKKISEQGKGDKFRRRNTEESNSCSNSIKEAENSKGKSKATTRKRKERTKKKIRWFMLKRSSKSNSVQRKWLTRGCEPS